MTAIAAYWGLTVCGEGDCTPKRYATQVLHFGDIP